MGKCTYPTGRVDQALLPAANSAEGGGDLSLPLGTRTTFVGAVGGDSLVEAGSSSAL